jgi:hypothetical protein
MTWLFGKGNVIMGWFAIAAAVVFLIVGIATMKWIWFALAAISVVAGVIRIAWGRRVIARQSRGTTG